MGYCDKCLNRYKKDMCGHCADNPVNFFRASYYTPYLEVCPINEWGCAKDPGFIRYYYPDRYQQLFGDITPSEALNHEECACKSCKWRNPEENENATSNST